MCKIASFTGAGWWILLSLDAFRLAVSLFKNPAKLIGKSFILNLQMQKWYQSYLTLRKRANTNITQNAKL